MYKIMIIKTDGSRVLRHRTKSAAKAWDWIKWYDYPYYHAQLIKDGRVLVDTKRVSGCLYSLTDVLK